MITHYEVLGVKENATSKEIRKAHIKLALCLHPDKNVGLNEILQRLVADRFLEVQEAYEALSDDARRKEYDEALAAVRSEGEYYIPAAPNPPVKPKEAAKCDKCQTMVHEPMHAICEACCERIAALEKEVKARRQLGVTACRLCGHRPLEKSGFPGVCPGCWRHIAILVGKQYADRRLVLCHRCGRRREAGRYCPDCGLDSVAGETWRSRKQSVAGMWKPAAGWSIVYLAQALVNGHWIADFIITMALLALYVFMKKGISASVAPRLSNFLEGVKGFILYVAAQRQRRRYGKWWPQGKS